MIRTRAAVAVGLAATAGATACFLLPGDCGGGGDVCTVSTYVAGRVSAPNGAPVPGLWLESQSASYRPETGCDTTAMQSHYEVRTQAGGSYVLSYNDGSFAEVHCSFIRLSAVGNPALQWNDTLVGPVQLGEFGAEPPDTAQVHIVLQPAVSASTRLTFP